MVSAIGDRRSVDQHKQLGEVRRERHWFSELAIIVLKVSTDAMGALTVVTLLIPAALCCSFFYFGVRRIRRASAGRRYPNRRDMGVKSDFIAEQFVPSEHHKQQTAMAQKLIAEGLNPQQVAGTLIVPVDRPSGEQAKDTKPGDRERREFQCAATVWNAVPMVGDKSRLYSLTSVPGEPTAQAGVSA